MRRAEATTQGASASSQRFGAAAGGIATVFVLAVLPVVCATFFLAASYSHDTLAYDFRRAYLPAAEAVLDGESPYVEVDDPRLAAETAYVYPPVLAYALTPLTALSEDAASIVVVLAGVALLAGALVLVGVRDWRCYTVTLVWAPSLIGLQTGSSSLLLAFAAACAWRFRDRVLPSAAAIGLGVATKLLLWPLLVWTLATRRAIATAAAAAVAATTVFVAWALLSFEDIARYPELLQRLAELEADDSYSVVGFAAALGLDDTVGLVLSMALGASLLAACVLYGRRGDDVRSFASAIAAALAFTPILWQHYLVLLLVPLAVVRPRFSAVWLLPVALWLAPREDNGVPLQTLLPLLAAAALVAFVLRRAPVATATRPAGSR